MHIVTSAALTRPANTDDAELIHAIYVQTPQYFDIISIPVPTRAEVERELEAAANDPRRHVELIVLPAADGVLGIADRERGQTVIGYLDYKLDYPDKGDATVNLLLILERLQSKGYGKRCVKELEHRLQGRAQRVLASIFGQNPRAKRFWSSLGYSFAIDAKPILDWYAKELAPQAEPSPEVMP